VTTTAEGTRFGFGRNWSRFLQHLDLERIDEAEQSLRDMLALERLDGLSVLDIGSGSGLFSLAAMRLGAERVFSFDYDPDSVACTKELRRRFRDGDPRWTVEQGDATDPAYVSSLGRFDVVYSWGVLHHTGEMWKGIDNACRAVDDGGRLVLALYNDLGWRSGYWHRVKWLYSRFAPLRPLLIAPYAAWMAFKVAAYNILRGRPKEAITYWGRKGGRGMTGWHDLIDWLGGYPYEVASPEQVFEFCTERGFRLHRLRTVHTLGNNEFVFVREDAT
jgi:2-polyprenyl-6-hydroxyphenyl methylase/3-demethylubiquinone-9 3-methyltransferase